MPNILSLTIVKLANYQYVSISPFIFRYFVYFFDLVIFANAVFIALERNDAEVLFLALFNMEILLKLYTYSFKEFFTRYWNMLVSSVVLLMSLLVVKFSGFKSVLHVPNVKGSVFKCFCFSDLIF